MRSWLSKPWLHPETEDFGWGGKLIGATQIPPQLDGSGVTVAVLDSGLDARHPDLVLSKGFDATSSMPTLMLSDEYGHGSFVAGISAATKNGFGVLGISSGVRLIGAKIGNVDVATGEFQDGFISGLLNGLRWARSNRADVINISVELTRIAPSSMRRLSSILTELVNSGIIIVAAAGNSGGNVAFPASHKSVISVGALGNKKINPIQPMRIFDPLTDYYIPFFSNVGADLNVVAPGVHIPSTMPGIFGPYGLGVGTSFSAPFVTAICALLVQAAGARRTRSADFVKKITKVVMESATSMNSVPKQFQGAGIANAKAAISMFSG